jgi:hypothetical protein
MSSCHDPYWSAISAAPGEYKYLTIAATVQSCASTRRVNTSTVTCNFYTMLDMEVTSLHWPSFCYNSVSPLSREQGKSVKRKWEEEDRSESSSPDQAVPEIDNNKKFKTDLPFSSLMRSMAAKYQTKQDTTATSIHNPLMSIFSPMTNPYSRLMASMAEMSGPKSVFSIQPLDLSNGASEQEVDVVSLEEDQQPLDQWNCHQVRDFIETIDNCEEYADIFFNEKIDGATLAVLSVTHLTTFLGVKMGHAFDILRRREERRRR